MVRQSLLQRRVEDPSPVFAAGVAPGQSGLQLITPGLTRPARFFRQRLLLWQRNYRMIHAVAQKVERERQGRFLSAITKLAVAGGPEYRHKPAHDDPNIEKIRSIGCGLERERRSRRVPGVIGEIARRAH